MPLRFLEVRLPTDVHEEVEALSEGHHVIDAWCVPADDQELHRYLLESNHVEPLIDALRSRFGEVRFVVMPVEATMPREQEEPVAAHPTKTPARNRVSREELYEDVEDAIALNPAFLALAILSAIVASLGLLRDDLVAIIGAMVIAPLLGPNVALALGTTLGDLSMIRRSLQTGLLGLGLSFLVAFGLGSFLDVDPAGAEILARTEPDLGHLVLALASGVAGGLAFTTGAPASLIGVMVAVALLPPLAAGAMLLGAGYHAESLGAFLLLATNLVAVNLAGIATFLAQGIRPLWHADQAKARRSARNAIAIWAVLLGFLAYMLATRIPREF